MIRKEEEFTKPHITHIKVRPTVSTVQTWQFASKRTSSSAIGRHNARRRSLRRSKLFKVTDVGTSREPICDFLSMINTDLYPLLPFPSYCRLLVKFALSTGGASL